MTIRTRKEVIEAFFATASLLEHIGFSVQPIPSFADPNDEIKGDTSVIIFFEIEREEGKLFCSPFRTSFTMDMMREIDETRFERNLKHWYDNALKHSQRSDEPDITIRAEDSPEHPSNRTNH